MNKLSIWTIAALAACAACGRESPPAATEPAEAPAPAATAADEAPPPAETVRPAPGESDGETVDASVSATPEPPAGGLKNWKAGENFIAYPVAQPVGTPPGKVEVVEGFWYGCGHCYSLEPRLEAWEKSKPDWIALKRTPVIWNEVTREDARLFFAIESLGLVEKMHGEVYREIHAKGRPLTVIRGGRVDRAATEKNAREFLTSRGVSEADFEKHYRSFSAENKLRQAENLARRYLLDHTPMMVVHGKYLTDVEMAGGVDKLFTLVNDLAAREHQSN
jgi:protein dithiol oxidoreductase (disulfide-forming)